MKIPYGYQDQCQYNTFKSKKFSRKDPLGLLNVTLFPDLPVHSQSLVTFEIRERLSVLHVIV